MPETLPETATEHSPGIRTARRTEPRRILLTSVGTGVGNAALTALRRSKHPYLAVTTNAEPFHSGVFRSDVHYPAPRLEDDPEGWLESVLKAVTAESAALVFPCRDAEIPVLAAARDALRQAGAELAGPDPAVAGFCGDKLATGGWLAGLGLAVPQTACAADPEGTARVAATGFPVVLKPRFGTGTVGVRLAGSPASLQALLDEIGPAADQWIVQEFLPIEGELHSVTRYTPLAQDREYSLQFSFGPDGRSAGWMATVNTLENGLPVAVRFEDGPAVRAVADRLRGTVPGVTGPLNLQGRLRGGEIVLFEANARLTGLTGARTFFGYHELDALWDLFVEHRAPEPPALRRDLCLYRSLEDYTFPLAGFDTLTEVGRWSR